MQRIIEVRTEGHVYELDRLENARGAEHPPVFAVTFDRHHRKPFTTLESAWASIERSVREEIERYM
jgi:hypothetical protein